MNESILQQFNCCVSCYFIAFFTVFLTLFMSSPSSHQKLESPLLVTEVMKQTFISLYPNLKPPISLFLALIICNLLKEYNEINVFQHKIAQTPCNFMEKSITRNPHCMKKRLKLSMRLCILARYFVCVHHKSVQIVSFCG